MFRWKGYMKKLRKNCSYPLNMPHNHHSTPYIEPEYYFILLCLILFALFGCTPTPVVAPVLIPAVQADPTEVRSEVKVKYITDISAVDLLKLKMVANVS